MRLNSSLITILLLTGSALFAGSEEKRLTDAADVFAEVMKTPDNAIPQGLIDKAQCVVIVPGAKKAGFIVGARYGRGFVNCRQTGGIGWTAPAAIRVEGGSVGFQIGVAETDVIMLVMNERGMKRLLSSKFTLGGDATAAAGPVGRNATAETDATMRAEILTWSRSRGLFAGVSLQGATLREDTSVNRVLYNKEIPNADILTKSVSAPAAANRLMSMLNKYSGRK
jgi:lipid-binding SYLF domain-containing protein